MSKIETLRSLPSAVQLVELTTETLAALESLTTLQTDVQRILTAYDTVVANQRMTLDELTSEMADRATAAFSIQTKSLSEQVSQLQKNIMDIQRATENIARLPSDLANTYHNATTATESLISEVGRLKPNLWKTALLLILAGAIGGVIAMAGTAALNRHQQPENAHNGIWAQKLWNNATPAQRSALTQIASEPEK